GEPVMVDVQNGDQAPTPADGGDNGGWALGNGRTAYFMLSGEPRYLPVLIELSGVTIAEFVSGEKLFGDDTLIQSWRKAVSVAPLFADAYGPLKDLGFVVALVTEEFFKLRDDSANSSLRRAIASVVLGSPLPERHLANLMDSKPDTNSAAGSQPGTISAPAASPSAPTPVVIGVIDDGIAFANERFRNGAQSRIEYLWIQDGVPPSALLPYGRELRASGGGALNDINAQLAAATYAGQIDEDVVYQRSRVLDFGVPGHKPLARRATHGTAVLDTAAGDSASAGLADRPIVAVQLPTKAVQDTSLNGLIPFIFTALVYILARSISVGLAMGKGTLPVVINLSFGNNAGPHDGTSPIERAIDQVVALWRRFVGPLDVVLPSGNSHLSRCHARFDFPVVSPPRREKVELAWRIPPDDRTPSVLQVWLPYQSAPISSDRVRLRVIAPGGAAPANATAWLGETGAARAQYPASGTAWCEVRYEFVPAPTLRGVFKIYLQPTTSLEFGSGPPAAPIAPSGVWTVEIENILLGAGEFVEAWIQRDDTSFTYPQLGRQSYFDQSCYRQFDDAGRLIEEDDANCLVTRAGTINAIATGREPVVMGGFLRKELKPARYSAGGPVTKPATEPLTRHGPDALAVSDDSTVHWGVLAVGSRSGSVFPINGTSIATPRITRWLASDHAVGNAGGRAAVAALADKYENGPPKLPRRPSIERGGAGRILLGPVYPISRFDR
ncbi:MAG TPA: hypothetical protein VJ924_03130, partial [Alphaproteobacteria bacterium]|nr:hypothetical protein [Alphaproteobacteria bacterium]